MTQYGLGERQGLDPGLDPSYRTDSRRGLGDPRILNLVEGMLHHTLCITITSHNGWHCRSESMLIGRGALARIRSIT